MPFVCVFRWAKLWRGFKYGIYSIHDLWRPPWTPTLVSCICAIFYPTGYWIRCSISPRIIPHCCYCLSCYLVQIGFTSFWYYDSLRCSFPYSRPMPIGWHRIADSEGWAATMPTPERSSHKCSERYKWACAEKHWQLEKWWNRDLDFILLRVQRPP